MPGFNQRGPMNQGPMTGRGRGVCTGSVDQGQVFGNSMGMGRGRGYGRRGCQAPGWGKGYGQWNMPAPAPANLTQETLQNRAAMLEAELAAIKEQLNNLSESKE